MIEASARLLKSAIEALSVNAKFINCKYNDMNASGTQIIGSFEEDLQKSANL
jgi:hypothetical protein